VPRMSGAGYWVTVSRDGTRLGAGFLLTGCYVLTAYHCLGDAAPEAADVEIEFEDGEVMPGRVLRRSRSADLALIDVPKSGVGPIIPYVDRASAGDAWRNPYRPSLSHAFLNGFIEAVPVMYQCEGGDSVEAMQLGCAQDLGDYAGYSGSPIQDDRPDGESKLFGILIEQYPEHYPDSAASMRASGVLFAATISEVFRRFDCFDLGHLISLLPSSSGDDVARSDEGDSKPTPSGLARTDVQSRIAIADAKIEALDGWQKRGLLDEQYVTALKLQVIQRHLLDDDAGEQP
jgi:Trypsin-like peptidase domain